MNTNVIQNKSFYYKDDFENNWSADSIASYALDISIDSWLQSVLKFPSDRIIYASNDYTFRERTRNRKDGNPITVGSLDLPYVSYYRTGYSECERAWWNKYANRCGVLDVANENYEQTTGKMKLAPVRAEYEATIFFSQQKDCEYALTRLLYENSDETILYPELVVNNETTVKNIAIMENDIEFNPEFNENDWLEQNKIFTISMNWAFDTFLIIGRDLNVSIAEEVILDFLSAKKLSKPDITKSEAIEQLTIYFDGK